MRALALLGLLFFSTGSGQTTGGGEPLPGQDTLAASTPSQTFAVRCGMLHVGDGTVLTDATLLVVEGRISAVGAGDSAPAIPEDMPVLDVSDRTVMPGIVAADTDLSGHGDSNYNVTPDFIALDGFDFERKWLRALSGGVTTIYLSPGRSRLISGQGSVVKLHGDDIVQRVLSEQASLRINMGPSSMQAPALFEPTPTPTSDDPLKPARKQLPSARISMLTTLRRIFREAANATPESASLFDGEGSAEDRYAIEPLQRAARGELPLRIATVERADAGRAALLCKQLGTRLVLEDPRQLEEIAAQLARMNATAVFRVPVRPGASNPGGEDRKNKAAQRRPEDPALAAAAGMRIALAPGSSNDLADTLLAAGVAIRHGLPPANAMRALCSDAADILGVGGRVGTLAAGHDADFLVLSGDPFAIGTMVEKTFIDGVPAYERKSSANLLAVRVDRILTMGENGNFRNGLIIVENGKIKAVGEELAIPYGASVLDLSGGVMVPGFIDAYSHVGLSGEGTGIPKGAADQQIADVVMPDDPLLRGALAAGLTTVLVSGTDGGAVSGRVAALKTGASDRKGMVLKETAAIRFVHDQITPDGIKSLADAIDRGAKYIKKWEDYDKALVEFEKGKIEEKSKKKKKSEPAEGEEAVADPISGTWELEFDDAPPFPITIRLELELDGTTVTGKLVIEIRGRELPSAPVEDGKFEDGKLTATLRTPMGAGTATATVDDDTMEGSIESPQGTQEFTAERVSKPGASSSSDDDDDDEEDKGPKKPDVDENLEPLRALLQKEIPAVVRSDRAPAISSVVKWFEEKELPYVLTGVKDAIDTPEILGEKRPPVLLGPDLIQREGVDTTNAAAVFSDRGHAVALGTGDTAGARYLPLHAALAVRYGMDPTEALKAMTIHAARMFKIDDRVGSLERGKDADFVVFSGNPFEMTSRVRLVVVNGMVAFDGEAEQR